MSNAIAEVLSAASIAADGGPNSAAFQPINDIHTGIEDAQQADGLQTDTSQFDLDRPQVTSLQFEPEMASGGKDLSSSILEKLDALSEEEKNRRAASSGDDLDGSMVANDVATIVPGPATAPLTSTSSSPGDSVKADWFEGQFGHLQKSFVYATEISLVTKIASNLSGNIQGLLTRN